MDASDIEIINLCIGGNVEVFEQLVERYKKLVFNTAYRMMGNREEAEDITQEAFIRIYNSLSRYNSQFKFSTWALKITSNLCLDNLRKRKGENLSIDEQFNICDDKPTPEELFLRKEKQRQVLDAINKLPEKYKEFIILFHSRNLSYQEIMDITGESLTIVKNRLYRARQMLKEYLISADKESENVCNVGK